MKDLDASNHIMRSKVNLYQCYSKLVEIRFAQKNVMATNENCRLRRTKSKNHAKTFACSDCTIIEIVISI